MAQGDDGLGCHGSLSKPQGTQAASAGRNFTLAHLLTVLPAPRRQLPWEFCRKLVLRAESTGCTGEMILDQTQLEVALTKGHGSVTTQTFNLPVWTGDPSRGYGAAHFPS